MKNRPHHSLPGYPFSLLFFSIVVISNLTNRNIYYTKELFCSGRVPLNINTNIQCTLIFVLLHRARRLESEPWSLLMTREVSLSTLTPSYYLPNSFISVIVTRATFVLCYSLKCLVNIKRFISFQITNCIVMKIIFIYH